MILDADIPTAQDMRDLGVRLARILAPGDLVVLDGPLGAGKTTLAQGIGAGLGIRGDVTSPTFVIAYLSALVTLSFAPFLMSFLVWSDSRMRASPLAPT